MFPNKFVTLWQELGWRARRVLVSALCHGRVANVHSSSAARVVDLSLTSVVLWYSRSKTTCIILHIMNVQLPHLEVLKIIELLPRLG